MGAHRLKKESVRPIRCGNKPDFVLIRGVGLRESSPSELRQNCPFWG